jgi:hypothetical protein
MNWLVSGSVRSSRPVCPTIGVSIESKPKTSEKNSRISGRSLVSSPGGSVSSM